MTTGKTELEGLLERVKAATGPDHELDVLICVALGIMPDITSWPPELAEGWRWELRPSSELTRVETWALHPTDKHSPALLYGRYPEPLTTSLDAALGLVERCLPGCCPEVGQSFNGTWWGAVRNVRDRRPHSIAPTPALALLAALLAALLTALIAQPNTPADRQGQVPEGDSDVG